MSNPYDPYNSGNQGDQSGDQSGYGQPYGSGGNYGSDPYGSPQGYGQPGYDQPGFGQATKTDAVSITGFILSLTCCLSIVGAILGFIGLGRTKNGQRKGRWAAISAAIIGIVGTLAFAGGVVGIVYFVNTFVSIDDAEVGQCVNIDETDRNSISIRKADCDKKHDGEIVYKGKKSEILESDFMPEDINDLSDAGISLAVCSSLMPQEDFAAVESALGDDFRFTIASEDPKEDDGDKPFVCLVEHGSGDSIDEQIIK